MSLNRKPGSIRVHRGKEHKFGWIIAAFVAIHTVGLLPAGAHGGEKKTENPTAAASSKPSESASKSSGEKSQSKEAGETAKAEEEPAAPDMWTAEEIADARMQCAKLLSKIEAITLPEEPFKEGECGTPAPVRVVSVGRAPQVVLSPPAVMTCRMASALHQWVTGNLQSLAIKHLDDQIIRIEVMSDYACRNTYGRKTGKLSEHALANALDVRGFVTARGKTARLLASWGPTARDIAAEKAQAEEERRARLEAQRTEKREAAAHEAEKANQRANTGQKDTAKQAVVKGTRKLLQVADNLADAAKTVIDKSVPVKSDRPPLSERITKEGRFLRAAHKSACKIFGTTLGPEANEAHRNHFHLDMRHRRWRNYCE